MKNIIFIMFFLLIILFPGAAENNFELYQQAWQNQNYVLALSYIEKEYEINPVNYVIHNYGIALFQNEKYIQAINILKKLPSDYYPYNAGWYIVESYHRLKDFSSALPVIEHLLQLPNDENDAQKTFYGLLVVCLINMDSDISNLFKRYENRILKTFDGKPDDASQWYIYSLCNYFIDLAKKYSMSGNDETAYVWFEKAITYSQKKFPLYQKNVTLSKPGSYFYENKDYKKAILWYSRIPDFHYPLVTAYYLADAYAKLNDYEHAKESILKRFGYTEETPYWKEFCINQLIIACNKLNDAVTISQYENSIINYFKSINKEISAWQLYTICQTYITAGYNLLSDFSIEQGSLYIKNALNIIDTYDLKEYKDYIINGELNIILKSAEYWTRFFKDKAAGAYNHRVKSYIITHVNAKWIDKNGKQQTRKNSIVNESINEYLKSFSLCKMVFFYLSDGNMLMEFDYEILDYTISEFEYNLWTSAPGADGKPLQRVDALSPVIETISPSLCDKFIRDTNKYDTFIITYDGQGNVSTGSKQGLPYVPYLYYGKPRGFLVISGLSSSIGGLVHEFFHSVEVAYLSDYTFTAHVFKNDFRSYWPSWYHGEGEYTYYKLAFRNICNKDGCKKLQYRKDQDIINEKILNKYQNLLNEISIEILKKGKQYENEAWLYNSQGKKDKAYTMFLKAYNNHIKNYNILNMIAYLTYERKEYKKAIEYYFECFDYGEATRDQINMVAYIYELLKDTQNAFTYYLKAYYMDYNHNDLYNAARVLYQKDNKKSLKYYKLYIDTYSDTEFSEWALNMIIYFTCFVEIDFQSAFSYGKKYFHVFKDKSLKANNAYYIAYALGEKGNLKEACTWLDKAEELGYSEPAHIAYYRKKYCK